MSNKEEVNPTQNTIVRCKVDICEEKVATRSIKEAKCIDLDCKKKEKQYRICDVVKAQKTFTLYTNLDLCLAIESIKSAELIKTKIENLVKKDEEVNKKYKDLAKSIKEIKNKYTEALELACKMERCIEEEERCHPDLLAKLRRKIENFDERLRKIPKKAEECYEKINVAFDSAIDVAGILTFNNIDSLTEFAKTLEDNMAKLRKDIDSNKESASTKLKDALKKLKEIIEAKTTTKFEKCAAITLYESLEKTYNFLCDPDCPDDCTNELEDICKKIRCQVPTHIPVDECKEESKDSSRDQEYSST